MNPRGLHCPDCKGVRLAVTTTRRPFPGAVVRYRRCSACGYIIKTEERVSTRPTARKRRKPEGANS